MKALLEIFTLPISIFYKGKWETDGLEGKSGIAQEGMGAQEDK